MGLFDFIPGLGDLLGPKPGGEYSDLYKQLAQKYGAMNPNLTAEQQQFDQPTRNAMLDAMGEYGNIAKSGGLDAIGRSQIAEANEATGREANQMAQSIQERAGAGPMRNSGVTLALAQGAGQNAMNQGRLAGMGAAAGAEARQRGALGGYLNAASTAGSAADAINEFNARLRQGTNEGNFQRRLQQLGGMGNAYAGGYGAARGDQLQFERGLGGIGSTLDSATDRIFGKRSPA